MTKEDLRVRRTHRLLREAFVKLVAKDGYENLTVREIARKAEVGYKTFYRYYSGKEALLQSILEELTTAFQQSVDRSTQEQMPLQNMIAALEFTKANAELFLAILKSPGADQLMAPMKQAAMQEGETFLHGMDVPDEVAVFHFASSVDSLMKWWLLNGMPYSVEMMADYINQLILLPVQALKQDKGDLLS